MRADLLQATRNKYQSDNCNESRSQPFTSSQNKLSIQTQKVFGNVIHVTVSWVNAVRALVFHRYFRVTCSTYPRDTIIPSGTCVIPVRTRQGKCWSQSIDGNLYHVTRSVGSLNVISLKTEVFGKCLVEKWSLLMACVCRDGNLACM